MTKFPGNPQSERSLVNEFIASRLCEYLELPIMDYKLINVRKENYTSQMKDEIIPLEGTAFGTLYNDKLLTVLNSRNIMKSVNSYDAIKILIFDLLIGNYDRNNGNLMIDSVTKKIIMIDHTHIFGLGTIWDQYQLPHLTEEKFDVHLLHQFNYLNIINSIKYDDIFYIELNKFIKKVKNLNINYVKKVMEDIPFDWKVNKIEKNLLINYIMNRFNRVDEVLNILNLKGVDSHANQS